MFKVKLKLPPRPALPSAVPVGQDVAAQPSGVAPSTAQPMVAGGFVGSNPAFPASTLKRRAEDDPEDAQAAKRPSIAQPATANGGAAMSASLSQPAPSGTSGAPRVRITIKRPVAPPVVAQPAVLAPAAPDKVQVKQLKEQQKQVAKEEKLRAKAAADEAKQRQRDEAAQEKHRQKMEAEQEKKRAQEQANFLKSIKLKIVHGSSTSDTAAGAKAPAAADTKPVAAAAAKPMAPSSLFLASTANAGTPGKVPLKPKIKLPVRPFGTGAVPGAKPAAGAPANGAPGSAAAGAAGTGASGRKGPPGAAAAAAASAAGPSGSSGPVDKGALDKILLKIQAKDARKIFLKPVTEDLAPNYFTVIKQPMDFTTMRKKIAAGAYYGWQDLQADLDLIFTNCMTYNAAGSIYHLEAKKMQEVARRLVELGRKGETNFRGRTANILKAHNAHIHAALQSAASKPLGRGMRRQDGTAAGTGGSGAGGGGAGHVPGAIRAAQVAAGVQHPSGPRREAGAAPDFHFLHHGHAAPPRQTRGGRAAKAGTLGANLIRRPTSVSAHLHLLSDLGLEGDARQTYHARTPLASAPFVAWSGLASGASTDGIPFANSRPAVSSALPPGVSTPHTYLSSVARFTSRCSAAVRRAVMGRLNPCVAVEGIVLPPEPDPLPEPPPSTQLPGAASALPLRPPAPGMGGMQRPAMPGVGAGLGARPPGMGMPGAGMGAGKSAPLRVPPGAMGGSVPALNLGPPTPQGNPELAKQVLTMLQGNPQAQAAIMQLLAGNKPPGAPGAPGQPPNAAAAAASNPLAMLLLQQMAQQQQQQIQMQAKPPLGPGGPGAAAGAAAPQLGAGALGAAKPSPAATAASLQIQAQQLIAAQAAALAAMPGGLAAAAGQGQQQQQAKPPP